LNGTAEALAEQVSEENFEKGLIFPPFTNIRKISAHIAAKVAAKAYELGELLLFPFLFSTPVHVLHL
jgi:malate dehydrogenase (oxaloacetate-decarboxylating)(NADP+)